MKVKKISLLFSVLSLFSLTAKADVVDTSSCAWVQISSTYLQSVVYSLQCNGFSPLSKKINITEGGVCTLTATTGYSVTGTCNSYVVSTAPIPSSSSSSSSSSAPLSACQASGNAGRFISYSSKKYQFGDSAIAANLCSPCQVYVSNYNSPGYSLSCASY